MSIVYYPRINSGGGSGSGLPTGTEHEVLVHDGNAWKHTTSGNPYVSSIKVRSDPVYDEWSGEWHWQQVDVCTTDSYNYFTLFSNAQSMVDGTEFPFNSGYIKVDNGTIEIYGGDAPEPMQLNSGGITFNYREEFNASWRWVSVEAYNNQIHMGKDQDYYTLWGTEMFLMKRDTYDQPHYEFDSQHSIFFRRSPVYDPDLGWQQTPFVAMTATGVEFGHFDPSDNSYWNNRVVTTSIYNKHATFAGYITVASGLKFSNGSTQITAASGIGGSFTVTEAGGNFVWVFNNGSLISRTAA